MRVRRLLPHFDAYGIACHPRSLLFPGRAAERALSAGQAGNLPLLLIDGEVGGSGIGSDPAIGSRSASSR